MPSSKFGTSPFPPLQLAHETQQQLADLATLLVDKAMLRYEVYLLQDRRTVDTSQWEFQRQLDDVRVYRERSSHSSQPLPPQQSVGDKNTYGSSTKLPVLLTVGTLQGDLYDVMYGGVLSPTRDEMRIKTSYVDDQVTDAAVLETLAAPSHTDPFRTLTIKYTVIGIPLLLRSIVKKRDVVYLESTGLARLPTTDELVGYQLLHSVTFPSTPHLATSLRGNISFCFLYRQLADEIVEVYGKGFIDPKGRTLRVLDTMNTIDVMISVTRYMDCAQRKKLAHALRRRDQSSHNSNATATSSHNACGVCAKPLSSLTGIGLAKMGQCRLCLQFICAACRTEYKLSAISPMDSHLHEEKICFCMPCVTTVTKTSALDVARDELAKQDAARGYGGSIGSLFHHRDVRGARAG